MSIGKDNIVEFRRKQGRGEALFTTLIKGFDYQMNELSGFDG